MDKTLILENLKRELRERESKYEKVMDEFCDLSSELLLLSFLLV